jgi:hypothetical protein
MVADGSHAATWRRAVATITLSHSCTFAPALARVKSKDTITVMHQVNIAKSDRLQFCIGLPFIVISASLLINVLAFSNSPDLDFHLILFLLFSIVYFDSNGSLPNTEAAPTVMGPSAK